MRFVKHSFSNVVTVFVDVGETGPVDDVEEAVFVDCETEQAHAISPGKHTLESRPDRHGSESKGYSYTTYTYALLGPIQHIYVY